MTSRVSVQVWCGVLVGLMLVAPSTRAEGVKVRLVYERSADASSCPSAEVLVVALRERLGYSPVDFKAREVIRVRITTTARRRLKAKVVWLDDAGRPLGERVLSAGPGGCDSLVADVALTVAVALDPAAVEALKQGRVKVRRPRRALELPGRRGRRVRPEAPSVAIAPPVVVEPATHQPSWHVGVVVGAVLGREADPAAPGGGLEVGLGSGIWSGALRLGVSGLGPQTVPAGARFSLVTPEMMLRGCVVPTGFGGDPSVSEVSLEVCASLAAGLSLARGEGPAGTSSSTRWVGGAGLLVGLTIPVPGSVRPYVEASVQVPFVRVRVVIDATTVFQAWPVTVGFGAGIRFLL